MNRREGFTLVELVVVVAILLLLTLAVVSVFSGDSGNKIREAGRIAQAAILGAKDRATHAKERRGIRIITQAETDSTGTAYAVGTGFAYLQPLPKITVGGPNLSMRICRPESSAPPDYMGNDATADSPRLMVLTGADATLILSLDQQGMMSRTQTRIRIPADSTGKTYVPTEVSPTPPYFTSTGAGGETLLLLTTNVIAAGHHMTDVRAMHEDDAQATAEFDIGNELLPQHQPMALPSGIVIDVSNSSPILATSPDIMYSPRGVIGGPLAAQGPIFLLLRDARDVIAEIDPRNIAADQHEQMIVAIFPQTGHVATFPVDQTDADSDGLADDLFRYAKTGQGAR